MLLASLYIATPALPIVAHADSGPSISIDPASVTTHSIGPAYPLVSPPTNNTITYTISLHNVGPSDMQAWNVVGKVDPNFFAIAGLPLASLSPLKPVCQANFGKRPRLRWIRRCPTDTKAEGAIHRQSRCFSHHSGQHKHLPRHHRRWRKLQHTSHPQQCCLQRLPRLQCRRRKRKRSGT